MNSAWITGCTAKTVISMDSDGGATSSDIAIDKIGLVKGQFFHYFMTMVMTGCLRYMIRKYRMMDFE